MNKAHSFRWPYHSMKDLISSHFTCVRTGSEMQKPFLLTRD